jgi:Tol biopolymer transport system component/DNA-binding winged helix-turn-helix (wHTH) protein
MPFGIRKDAPSPSPRPQRIAFDNFEVDLRSGEVRKNGTRIRLQAQPFQLLVLLLQNAGDVVSREEICRELWPADTFVDFEHSLAAAVNKIREALVDSADNPRYIETLPKRGYRFIGKLRPEAPVVIAVAEPQQTVELVPVPPAKMWRSRMWILGLVGTVLLCTVVIASTALFLYRRTSIPKTPKQHALTALTFDDGLQIGATWSPDGRFIAYSSDRGGKFDIWVQQVSGGAPVQITKEPGTNWQPDWSPDGRYIAYRSEDGDGGLYIIPVLGGAELARKIASFGYYPRWSPDASQLLFRTTQYLGLNRFYVVGLDGDQPREVLTEFPAAREATVSAAWYPDGKRVSVWVANSEWSPDFRTVPLQGGPVVKSVFAPEVGRELREVASSGIVEQTMDFTFSWAPSGRSIYCAQTFRGALNLWKLTVDPSSLQVNGIERLTTGPGPDSELALSRDGSKLAFTAELQHIRAWVYPFDASGGKVTGPGQPVSPAGMSTWRHSLSRDGTSLAFSGSHAGRPQLWIRSLEDSSMVPVIDDDYIRDNPRWSRDGKRLLYGRWNVATHENVLVLWSAESRNEKPICDATNITGGFDWLPDDSSFLVTESDTRANRAEIWRLPADAGPHSGTCGRRLISDPTYDLYQPNVSPDGRWIAFGAVRDSPTTLDSTLYVTPASGGQWTKITDGKQWSDKPRWSPDGKIIYFVSRRDGFFNVWGIHFDPVRGAAIGRAFPVTSLDNPKVGMPQHLPSVDVSLNQDHLVLTIEEVSGNLWVLDNLNP